MGGYALVILPFIALVYFGGAEELTIQQRLPNKVSPITQLLSKQQQQQQQQQIRELTNGIPMQYLSGHNARELKRKRSVLPGCWLFNKNCVWRYDKKQNNKSNALRPSNFWITGKRDTSNIIEEGNHGRTGKEKTQIRSHDNIKAHIIKLAMEIIFKMDEMK